MINLSLIKAPPKQRILLKLYRNKQKCELLRFSLMTACCLVLKYMHGTFFNTGIFICMHWVEPRGNPIEISLNAALLLELCTVRVESCTIDIFVSGKSPYCYKPIKITKNVFMQKWKLNIKPHFTTSLSLYLITIQ